MGKRVDKNSWFEKQKKDIIKKALHKAELDFMVCARRINNDIYDDVNKMYRTLIEQFYDYETSSYIRHWEGKPGTRHGENLLYGNQIRKNNQASHSPKLIIDFSGENMAPYKHQTTDKVLDYVMNGVRFPIGPMLVDTSRMEYYGKHIQFQGGTIQDAFDKFDKEWDEIAENAFYSIWDEYVSKW